MQQGVRYLYFGHLHAWKSTITLRMLQELGGDILLGITCMEGVTLLGFVKDLGFPHRRRLHSSNVVSADILSRISA
jgi:hypothetical protein